MKKKRYYLFARYLDKGEIIMDVAHKHILVFKFAAAKAFFFGIFLPIFIYLLFPLPKVALLTFIWGGVGFFVVFYHFVDWYFDAWLLTNLGVIAIERNGFFDVTSTRVDYHMMEGIAYTVKGFLATLFNFGDITIDKLGAKTSVLLKDAASPNKLERKVMKYQEKFVDAKSFRDHTVLKDMLSQMIAYHANNEKIDVNKKE